MHLRLTLLHLHLTVAILPLRCQQILHHTSYYRTDSTDVLERWDARDTQETLVTLESHVTQGEKHYLLPVGVWGQGVTP